MPSVPTPDDQVAAFKDQPFVTPNEVAHAEGWARRENVHRRNFGLEWANEADVRSREVHKATAAALREATRLSDDLIVRAQHGDYETVDQLFKELADLRAELVYHERTIAALATTEQTIAEVKADGAAWFHMFFEKYPALQHRVASLADEMARYRTSRR
jgi:hypothetical protein